MPEFSEIVTIEAVVALRATEKALLCRIDGADHWIPQSQIDDRSEVFEAEHEGKLVISQWCAECKGLG